MLLAHAFALTEARTYLAALADRAPSVDASHAYEEALLYLDSIHGDQLPAISTADPVDDRAGLHPVAESAIERLGDYGVDRLQLELVLAMLEEARELDVLA